MRIGHYMRNMFEPGGIASYISRVSESLRAMGHQVVLFDRLEPDGNPPAASESLRKDDVVYTSNDEELFRKAREARLDLLHLHRAVDSKALAGAGLPVVRTVHTHSPYCPSTGRFLRSPGMACDRTFGVAKCLWGHVVNRCGSVRPGTLVRNFSTVRDELAGLATITTIAVSQFMKDQMVRAGYPAERVHVISLMAPDVQEAVPPPRQGTPRLLFLGRMYPHKGVDWLLRAMTRTTTDVHLDLAGTGNEEATYRALARQLGLDGRVTFHGWVGPQAVQDLLRSARALVFPSLWHEPGGMVAFEAMAQARAVIISRVGGLPEVVEDGRTGIIIDPGDTTALAAAIDRLAIHWDEACRFGSAARARVLADYTLAKHMGRLTMVYRSLHERFPSDIRTASPTRLRLR